MSLRLTASLRGELLDRLLTRAFAEREKALALKFQTLALLVYTQIVVPRKGYERAKALGSLWIYHKTGFRVQFGGSAGYTQLSLSEPLPFYSDEQGAIATFDANDPLTLQYNELGAKKKALRQEKQKIFSETEALLGSVTTAKSLLETWPEIGTLCKDLLVEKPKQEVLVPGGLNKVFDLPVGKKGGVK